jgi:acetyl esterase/lipase
MKTSILIIATLMISIGTVFSQTEIPLWKGDIPRNKAGINVDEINDDSHISKVTIPALYHFKAQVDSSELKPAIIIIPGGGYWIEAIDHEGWMAAKWFAERGFEAFVLKYRLPDETMVNDAHLVPLMDAQEAIALVRSRASEFGINPENIGIIGFSAGGHLAASASTLFGNPINNLRSPEDIRPDFSILMYPVITMDDRYTHQGSKENLIGKSPTTELVSMFSMENQVSGKTPVTLLIHAIDDNAVSVQNSDLYADNLHKNGGDVTKIILPFGGHGFGFRTGTPISSWTDYLEVWLNSKILSE